MHPTRTDSNGNMVLPGWFLKFLSVAVTLTTIAFIPWAAAVTRNLNSLTNEITALRVQSDGRSILRENTMQNINQRIERIESKLDRLEQQRLQTPPRILDKPKQ